MSGAGHSGKLGMRQHYRGIKKGVSEGAGHQCEVQMLPGVVIACPGCQQIMRGGKTADGDKGGLLKVNRGIGTQDHQHKALPFFLLQIAEIRKRKQKKKESNVTLVVL